MGKIISFGVVRVTLHCAGLHYTTLSLIIFQKNSTPKCFIPYITSLNTTLDKFPGCLNAPQSAQSEPCTCLSRRISCSSSFSLMCVLYSCSPAAGERPRRASISNLNSCSISNCFLRSSISYRHRDKREKSETEIQRMRERVLRSCDL